MRVVLRAKDVYLQGVSVTDMASGVEDPTFCKPKFKPKPKPRDVQLQFQVLSHSSSH